MPEPSERTDPLDGVKVGMTGRQQEDLTVGGQVEGMPLVSGTPMMIMLMENVPGRAVAAHLPPTWATVGSQVNIRHLAPTPVGRTVTSTAEVVEVQGRSVLFAVEAHDGDRKIGEGVHRRGGVDPECFA